MHSTTETALDRRHVPGLDHTALQNPAAGYEHPDQVLRDDALSTSEKRSILSSWASDANAIEQQPPARRRRTATERRSGGSAERPR
jgi:hypothetical protein